MIEIIIGLTFSGTCIWWSAPRFFYIADTYLAQRILRGSVPSTPVVTIAPQHVPQRREKYPSLLELSSLSDSLARATRSGLSSHDAFMSALDHHTFTGACWTRLYDDIAALHPCSKVLETSRQLAIQGSSEYQCLALLSSAMVESNLVPSAIDHASLVLRDRAACQSDLAVAASQARLSARMLTSLPFVLLIGAVLISAQFRNALWTPIVILALITGLILNRVGWRWISSLISHAVNDEEIGVGELTEHLCVSLRTGLSMTQACERWRTVSPIGYEIAELLSSGASLEQALLLLTDAHHIAGKNLGHIIIEAERDGLPILDTVTRLAADSRTERRRLTDTRIRQLPTRLTIPLVLCVLPSFLLLAIAPIVLASLSQLTISLPPVTQ